MPHTKFEIHNTDCFVKLAELPANSIDMMLVDPPLPDYELAVRSAENRLGEVVGIGGPRL